MSEKKFTLLDAVADFDTASVRISTNQDSNFELCFICQEPSEEQLVCPATNSTRTDKSTGYLTLVQQLKQFETIGELPISISSRVNYLSCNDLLERFVSNKAKFPKKCSQTKAQTFELDRKVRNAANHLCDEMLLAKLSEGDMIAVEALYHKSCLSALYNRLRDLQTTKPKADSENPIIEGIVLAEILDYLKNYKASTETIPVFKLNDLKSLYLQRLKEYGCLDVCMENIHSTRLKEKILSRIPELHESKKGRDVVLTFKDEVGSAIYKACKQDFKEDGMCLSSAANIVRKQIFQHIQATEKFSLEEGSQNTSVPRSLVTLISKIIGGSSISGNVSNAESKIALNISQLILFNVVKHKLKRMNWINSDTVQLSKHLFHYSPDC